MKQLFFFILTFFLVVLSGCKTAQPTIVERHTTDTVRLVSNTRDSIYVHDSIWVTATGDTVKIERWRTKYIERMSHDTIYQSKTDTIPVPYPVEKEVPAKLTWWQQTRMGIGTWALILTALFVLYKIIRSKMRI
jgi:hypothetical protein